LAISIDNWYGGWPKHLFLKLHGGINWWMINGRLTYVRFASSGDLNRKWNEYSKDPNSADQPVILEPSAYKYCGDFYKLLSPQWSKFFERLCEADCIVIIGYSLPEGDAQARSKMMTAFNINKRCKWLLIDPSEATCARFIRLLGQKSLTVLRKGLVGFNHDVRAYLQQAFPDIDPS
jgi:hypothetical protein